MRVSEFGSLLEEGEGLGQVALTVGGERLVVEVFRVGGVVHRYIS